jgi:hypothetical protein
VVNFLPWFLQKKKSVLTKIPTPAPVRPSINLVTLLPLPHTFIYSAFPRTFNANWMRIQHGCLHTYVKTFAISIIYMKILMSEQTFIIISCTSTYGVLLCVMFNKKKILWTRRINERVWKRHNAYGRRSIIRICWLPIVLQQKWSMYILTWARELSTYLRNFFHSSACTLCSLSLLF